MRLARKPQLFYGWYIVAAGVMGGFMSAGMQVYIPGAFLKPMTEDLGWSREGFSSVQSLTVATGGMLAFFIGGFLDRRGPRLLMLCGTIVLGASLIATAFVTELWQFYIVRGVAQAVGIALVGNIVVTVTVSRWFVARRGMALALASVGVSMGGVSLAPLVTLWVDAYGWERAWMILGVIVWVVMLPAIAVMKRSPEDAGLLPDGMTADEAEAYATAHNRVSAANEVQWTRPEAVRTPALWLIILGYGAGTIGIGALLLHMIPFLTDSGFSEGQAAMLFAVLSWAALLCKFAWGWLMERYHARSLSAISFVMAGVAIPLIVVAGEAGMLIGVALALILYGFAVGGTQPLQESVWAGYFGRAHLGKIRAVAMPFTIIFSAGGPFLGGALYDRTGSYTAAFLVFAGFAAMACLLLIAARPPRHPAAAPLPAPDALPGAAPASD